MFDRLPYRDWPEFAEAMHWDPADDIPSWMTPGERGYFWRQVAEMNRQAAAAREVERVKAELAEMFSPPILWLASLTGRFMSKLHR